MSIQQLRNLTTLCYIEQDGKYLMLHRVKKENDINKDKWIGVGGHFEADESPEDCVLREVKEETGYTLTAYRFRGIITFLYRDVCEYMCLYTADGLRGNRGSVTKEHWNGWRSIRWRNWISGKGTRSFSGCFVRTAPFSP